MKRSTTRIAIAMLSHPRIDLIAANAATAQYDATAATDASGAELDAANASADGDWYRIAKYGEYPIGASGHGTVIQVFDEAAANALIDSFSNAWARIKAAFGVGNANVPVYNGHPDDAAFIGHPKYGSDNTVYAHVEEMEKREDGLYGRFAKSNAYGDLSKLGKLRISPRWGMQWMPKAEHGPARANYARPVKLLSIGLVDRPNMADAAFANALTIQNQTHNENAMNQILKAILAALGFSNARIEATANGEADAISLTEAENALTQAQTSAANAALDPVQTDLATANAQITELTTERDAAAAELATANAALQTHRSAHAELLVDAAVSNGQITLADRDAEIEALSGAEDFTAAANALAERKPTLPGRQAAGAAKRKGEELLDASNAASQLVDIANGILNEGKARDYQSAYSMAKRANPALLEATRQPKADK